jgi:ppGpp synthetase/RelA/SpoT-type nucleotidyltranferase
MTMNPDEKVEGIELEPINSENNDLEGIRIKCKFFNEVESLLMPT